jgi:predicted HD phosphohydrolase
MAVRRMDQASSQDWAEVKSEIVDLRAGMPDRIKRSLLELRELRARGFMVDQLTHCLQTATLAERGGASEEVVLAALLHDIGKTISPENHGAIAAEILRPVVSDDVYWLVRTHQEFQGRFFFQHIGKDPETYRKYESHPRFELGIQFSNWDQQAFDPSYPTLPLEHFEQLFAKFWTGRKP